MKTTIDIADAVLERVKQIAEKRGTTMKAIVEGALRDLVESEFRESRGYTFRPHTYKGQGLQNGLQEGDWSRILERSYEGRGG